MIIMDLYRVTKQKDIVMLMTKGNLKYSGFWSDVPAKYMFDVVENIYVDNDIIVADIRGYND